VSGITVAGQWQVSGSIDDLVLKKSEKRNHHLTSPHTFHAPWTTVQYTGKGLNDF
jgi:hypothetical protein